MMPIEFLVFVILTLVGLAAYLSWSSINH